MALRDRTFKNWDASTGQYLQTLDGYSRSLDFVAFSHDPAQLVSTSYDNTVKIWNANIGHCLTSLAPTPRLSEL